MTIEKKLDNGTLTLRVVGRLDTNTAPQLQDEVRYDGVTKLVFDFSALDYLSSAGLRILLMAQKTMSASGGAMEILSPNATVRSVFDMTGCSDIFTIL
ncbi:MAG: STAS domain-containing protein [Kiritimatiellae bacterium]|nr:STAS domain-containing protein [Kiritimatiellia bacterium]MBP5226727.1 STAS domain-containing protein [Kiritimatiellia bacterium]